MSYTGLTAETIQISGHENTMIDAYIARPSGSGPFPGVVVIHHMPGWDEWTTEVVRRFAHNGYAAIAPNLHFRAGSGSLEEVVQRVRDAGGSKDEFVLGDIQASLNYLNAQNGANGKIGVIGFCSGGRIAYMAGCKLPDVNAAVDCWGGNVIVPPERLTPAQPEAVIDMTSDLDCPILGLFGNEDQNPDPAMVDRMEEELTSHGKTYEFYRYDGAGHAFFAWERPNYRQEQAADGWQKVYAFYQKYLG